MRYAIIFAIAVGLSSCIPSARKAEIADYEGRIKALEAKATLTVEESAELTTMRAKLSESKARAKDERKSSALEAGAVGMDIGGTILTLMGLPLFGAAATSLAAAIRSAKPSTAAGGAPPVSAGT